MCLWEEEKERVVRTKETCREWLLMNNGFFFKCTSASADLFLEFKYHPRSSLKVVYFKDSCWWICKWKHRTATDNCVTTFDSTPTAEGLAFFSRILILWLNCCCFLTERVQSHWWLTELTQHNLTVLNALKYLKLFLPTLLMPEEKCSLTTSSHYEDVRGQGSLQSRTPGADRGGVPFS